MVSTARKVILVTGANRGIGLAIVKSLAVHPKLDKTNILVGCRDVSKGQAAIAGLHEQGVSAALTPIKLDVTSDVSIRRAVSEVESEHGQLDVLINNAGAAMMASAPDFSDVREAFSTTYNINVISVALTMSLFLPLLRKSVDGGKIINVSSSRGSIARSVSGQLPPTLSVAYGVSKTALNALTVETSRQEQNQDVEFQLVCPGHCKTEFNGFRGARDPSEGANVVVELVVGNRRPTGYWETKGSSRELVQIPW